MEGEQAGRCDRLGILKTSLSKASVMTNYWAIAIGINQYQRLEPLLYAQWDAQSLHRYWLETAQFAPRRCRLLADTAPAIAGESALPTADRIQHQIAQVCRDVRPTDVLWCFFSGYGMQHEGADYLMPIDGDPDQVAATGVAVGDLMRQLRRAATDNILLLLDMKRPPQAPASLRLGAPTAALAEEYGLATILSCRADQTSHETLALRQGLFTHALLEGLAEHNSVTLEQITQYLSDRLPELSDRHWRPRQDPVFLIPPDQSYQLIVPSKPARDEARLFPPPITTAPEDTQPTADEADVALPPQPQRFEEPVAGAPSEEERSAEELAVEEPTVGFAEEPVGPAEEPVATPAEPSPTLPAPAPTAPAPVPQKSAPSVTPAGVSSESSAPSAADDFFWRRLVIWGGVIVALLMLGVLLRNREALWGEPDTPPIPVVPEPTESDAPEPEAEAAPESIAPLETSPGEAVGSEVVVLPGDDPKTALESARLALEAGDTEEALRWLELVPPDSQTEEYVALRAAAEQGNPPAEADPAAPVPDSPPASAPDANPQPQAGEAILDEAIASLDQVREETPVNQASDFARAIAIANRIQPGQPFYDESQTYIQRWGRVILDLAEARARSGNYRDAIAAAQLLPPELGELYEAAQRRIGRWQTQLEQQPDGQQIINQARGMIRYNQASSYSQAIALVQTVAPDDPAYGEAQALAEQWSRAILDLAYARASEGGYYIAIDAANLVPTDAPQHAAAQEAIAQWRQRLGID
ncbi:MAG: caspase domain-containing protein [Elainellaceae cyanobacterium]